MSVRHARVPVIAAWCAATVVAVIASVAIAAPAPRESWAKPGVTLEQYRADSLDCGKQGYYLDLSQTDDAKAFVRGTRELEDVTQSAAGPAPGTDPIEATVRTANQYERIRRSVAPERRYEHLKAVMQAAVARCLVQRGYIRFALTDDQRRRLQKLPAGSPDRKAFLYALAVDPASPARAIAPPAP